MPRKTTVYVKPPSPARTMFSALIVLAVVFLLFGLVFVFVAEGEARLFALMFFLLWAAACIAMMAYAAKSLRLINAGKIESAEIDEAAGEAECGFAAKLRELEALKRDGFISEDEYGRKRAEIMRETW